MVLTGAALSLSILFQTAAAAPAPANSSASPVATPSAATPPAPAEPASDPAAVAANLADIYEKSCGGRIYGTYAEACNNLAESLKQARAAARKAERAKAAGK